jgi:hypothetical protein
MVNNTSLKNEKACFYLHGILLESKNELTSKSVLKKLERLEKDGVN